MDPTKIKPLITKEEIASKIKEISIRIENDYQGKDLVIVMILKGAICLVADLMRELNLPLDLQTVQCSSYRGATTRGELTVMGIERLNIKNRDVLIVDDIFDSGHTIASLKKELQTLEPRSVKSCVLLNKLNVPKVTEYLPEYVLFNIPDAFVIGYGLDFQERYRGLSDVCILEAL
jgi:hypoxanthine phosphoribosyltransferase